MRGSYDALMQRDFYENTAYGENYMRIILTDEEKQLLNTAFPAPKRREMLDIM